MLKYFLSVVAAGLVVAIFSGLRVREADQRQNSVPEWAKSAVWYQIFPERFRNGDVKNDPKPSDSEGSWPHTVTPGWQISKWDGDWYELQSWERDGKGFYFHAQQRRYGGDLQGVIDKLEYLKDLGITAIYLNPIFESPSLHKYDATFYHHIDDNFGPDPDGDKAIWAKEQHGDPRSWQWTAADRLFLQLVQAAHQRKIKVIIDGVFNHCGMTFWAFLDVKKNQQASEYKDWFTIKRWDDPATKDKNEFDYEGWFGVRELPELREDENGLVRGPREHVKAIVQRWMDPNGDGNPEDGIDGWRLDVAEKVNKKFWQDFRTWVRGINPEAYLVGEVWWEDWNNEKMFNAAPWLQGDVFDAVMNYRWAREGVRYFAGQTTKIQASEFSGRLRSLLSEYPADNNYVLMNLYDSHDTDRLGSRIVNRDLSYDKRVGQADNRDYDVRKPAADELRTQELMALFQMTCLGAPTIYYGTEAGMWGGDDPDCRKPMLWPEFTYDPERSHPFQKSRPSDSNIFNKSLLNHYKKMIGLRNRFAALGQGEFATLLSDDQKDVFCYLRSLNAERIIVVLNNSGQEQDIQLSLKDGLASLKWKAQLDEKNSQATKGRIQLTLKPKSGEVFEGVL
ncbi:MAG: glycoside hydrolase family 13 protein [Bacteroidota bacterium]